MTASFRYWTQIVISRRVKQGMIRASSATPFSDKGPLRRAVNPMTQQLGFSDLLLDEPEDGYDPDTRRIYARTIRDSGQHLVSLINDILDLSKVEAGRMELHLEPVRIDELVARVAAAVEPLATEKELRLTVDTGGAGQLVADERFVELYGGRIWVESAPGEGSRFHVELPARPALPAHRDREEAEEVMLR